MSSNAGEANEPSLSPWSLFEASLARGDSEATQQALAAAVEQESGPAAAFLRISQAARRAGLLEMAIEAALSAASHPFDSTLGLAIADHLLNLGEARTAARLCAGIDSDDPDQLHECARLLMYAGAHDAAGPRLEQAAAAGLDTAAFHKTRATLHAYFGEAGRAEESYLAAMQRGGDPLLASPLSRVRTWSAGHNHVERLLAARSACAPGSAAFADVSYALFRQLDDMGRYDEAWPMLEAGAGAWRAGIDHDATAHSRLVDNLISLPLPATAGDVGADAPAPIFILGLPRAGSTLLERLLGEHPQVTAAGELPDFVAQARRACGLPANAFCDQPFIDRVATIDSAELGRRYLEHTGWRADGRRRFVDKQPMNFLHLGLIQAALPSARIIHAVREPVAACFSIFNFLFARAHHYSYDLAELAAWYHDYRRLMRHWQETVPGRILDVSHEALLADPQGEMRRVRAFCGLDEPGEVAGAGEGADEGPRRAPVATGSAMQVAGPMTSRYANRWQPYAPHLEGLRRELARYDTPA